LCEVRLFFFCTDVSLIVLFEIYLGVVIVIWKVCLPLLGIIVACLASLLMTPNFQS